MDAAANQPSTKMDALSSMAKHGWLSRAVIEAAKLTFCRFTVGREKAAVLGAGISWTSSHRYCQESGRAVCAFDTSRGHIGLKAFRVQS